MSVDDLVKGHKKQRIMVWRPIEYDNRTDLVLAEGRMNVRQCITRMVNLVVILFVTRVPNGIFLQDNARPHSAVHTRNALENVRILDWPAVPLICYP